MPNANDKLKKVPKGALKNFLNAGKSTTRVIGKVERFVLSKPFETGGRAVDALHPSAMVSKYWCHRTSYYNLLGYSIPPQERSFKRELIFAQGHGIHETWQNWFAQMGKLYGMWKCTECEMADWMLSPVICPKCGIEDTMVYREVPVQHDALRIKGHADGWLKGFGSDLLLEIKSIGTGTFLWLDRAAWMEADQDFDKAWKNLKHPFESHVSQVQLYGKVLELSGVPDVPKEAIIIYEAKPNQEIKEFIVQLDDWGIGHLIDAAQAIVDAVAAGEPPVCNIGGAAGCRQCNDMEALVAGDNVSNSEHKDA